MASSNTPPKPKWWQLYLSFPLLVGLFLIDTHLQLSSGGHEAFQMGSLFLEFILVQVWLRANSKAMNYMDEEEFARTIHVLEIPPCEPTQVGAEPEEAASARPLELRGVLGDAFEMNYIEAKSLNVDANAERGEKDQE